MKHFAGLLIFLLLGPFLEGCGGSRIVVATMYYTVVAEDGFQLQAYTSFECENTPRVPEKSLGVLLYCQGSDNRSALGAIDRLAGATAMGMQVLMVERRGVDRRNNVDEPIARRFDTKQIRVSDTLTVLREYLSRMPLNGPVVVVGASEGGDVAAAVAAREPKVTHLVLLGTGGGFTQADELRLMVAADNNYLHIAGPAALEATLAKIQEHSDADELWLGHPFRRWSTYAFAKPLDDLRHVQCPILLIHGTTDTNVPIESARAVQSAFVCEGRTNLTYIEHVGLDHRFTKHLAIGGTVEGYPLVEDDVVRWFAALGVLSKFQADVYLGRLHRNHPEWFGES